jgi:hypothetical protein
MEKADYFEHSDECPFCNKVNRLRFRKMHPTKKRYQDDEMWFL